MAATPAHATTIPASANRPGHPSERRVELNNCKSLQLHAVLILWLMRTPGDQTPEPGQYGPARRSLVTYPISRRVEVIQADTGGAVTAIEQISRVIARISDFQTTIASAVEEQTATTGETNRSVSEAATGAGDVAQNITGVAEAARLTSEGVAQSQQATSELARLSASLKSLVTNFRY